MPHRITAIVAAALLLAIGMAGLGIATARALRERDRAVREGVLLGLTQELVSDMRQHGPEEANAALAAFVERHRDEVSGVELVTSDSTLAHAGSTGPDPTTSAAALGPAWRGIAQMSERGGFGRGTPPFTFRLHPAPALGRNDTMATAIVAVSSVGAAALFVFALLAARGLVERERRLAAEAEQQSLRIAALAGAGLAHRIRTPLATIKGTAQLIESQAAPSPERARRIVDEAVRIDAMIRRLLDFARPPEPQAERFDVASAVTEAASRAEHIAVTAAESAFAYADPTHFESALEELVANARAFDEGPIAISVTRSAGQVIVEVRDHGPGLSVDAGQALQPYVTTRPEGTGLGLSIARALMKSNGGELTLRNGEGGGCAATIRLPEAT